MGLERWLLSTGFAATLACSDAIPPPSLGAATITVSQGSQGSCRIQHLTRVPRSTTLSSLDPGEERVTHEEDGATVRCSLSGSRVDAEVQHERRRIGVVFDLESGAGSVTHYDPLYAQTLSGSTCTVNVLEVSKSSIWGTFTCELLRTDTQQCAASGSFVFDDCE